MNERQPRELLARIFSHCMTSRWQYIKAGRTIVKPYLACLAAANNDVWPLLEALDKSAL